MYVASFVPLYRDFSPHESRPSPCHPIYIAAGQEEQILLSLILKHFVLFDFLPRKLSTRAPRPTIWWLLKTNGHCNDPLGRAHVGGVIYAFIQAARSFF